VVSVLSAFARMDFDPWQQAADFAQLPKAVARTRLATMIATLPGMLLSPLEPETIAARLIDLLPVSPRPAEAVQTTAASQGRWWAPPSLAGRATRRFSSRPCSPLDTLCNC
jgi:hypothetical protein